MYPHYLRPFPSCSIACFDAGPAAAKLTSPVLVPRDTLLHSRSVRGVSCRFRSTQDVVLAPIRVAAARFSAVADAPMAVSLPTGSGGAISLSFELLGEQPHAAALGLAQLTGIEGLFFGMVAHEPVIGTYASKNTYANLLAMAVPLAVLSLWGAAGRQRRGDGERRSPWWGVLALLTLLAAALASASRTGIATALLVALLALALLAPAREGAGGGRGGWLRRLALPALVLGLLAVALFMGGLDWVERFDAKRLAADDALRALTREATWQGALAYWPLGSGLGSYAWVFPRFQAPEVGRYWLDLAHNDYLQILMETGVLGLAAMMLALALMGRRVVQLVRAARGGWSGADRVAVACGLGLLATLLHAWVDYPLRIPANAMLAAFLLGVFLREPTPGSAGQHV